MRIVDCLAVAALVATFTAGATSDPAKTYGAAWSPALGTWLPNVDSGFMPFSRGQAAYTNGADYFVCDNARPIILDKNSFQYAGRGCPQLKKATAYAYGTGEPITGHILYDRTHSIALFDAGCCAWRGFVLTSTTSAPPKTLANMPLQTVHTMRGASLGMTQAQIVGIYGQSKPHTDNANPGANILSYATIKKADWNGGAGCGQFQNFAFKKGRLVSIQLIAGC
jgi:hypothetical protein